MDVLKSNSNPENQCYEMLKCVKLPVATYLTDTLRPSSCCAALVWETAFITKANPGEDRSTLQDQHNADTKPYYKLITPLLSIRIYPECFARKGAFWAPMVINLKLWIKDNIYSDIYEAQSRPQVWSSWTIIEIISSLVWQLAVMLKVKVDTIMYGDNRVEDLGHQIRYLANVCIMLYFISFSCRRGSITFGLEVISQRCPPSSMFLGY